LFAIFDVGGVVSIGTHGTLPQAVHGNETAMEYILAAVCAPVVERAARCRSTFADGLVSLKQLHPDKAKLIDAWFER